MSIERVFLESLFPLMGAASDDAALDVAAAFAAAHDTRLVVQVPAPMPTPTGTPWGITDHAVISELLALVEREAAQRADVVRQRLRDSRSPWEVRVDRARFGDPCFAFARYARCSDFAIVCRPTADDGGLAHAYFGAALLESGRPVVVVPPNTAAVTKVRRMLLAWKSTRESARALHDALALFAPTHVDVAIIDPEADVLGDEEPGADIAAFLKQRGLDVTITTLPSGGKGIATTLLLHAAGWNADLVVAGGYGHSRLREWALGGTTRELLEELQVPVLFSH